MEKDHNQEQEGHTFHGMQYDPWEVMRAVILDQMGGEYKARAEGITNKEPYKTMFGKTKTR